MLKENWGGVAKENRRCVRNGVIRTLADDISTILWDVNEQKIIAHRCAQKLWCVSKRACQVRVKEKPAEPGPCECLPTALVNAVKAGFWRERQPRRSARGSIDHIADH